MFLAGVLKGHDGPVTTIATTGEYPNMILSGSRDKKLMIWDVARRGDAASYGVPKRSLVGHQHFVQDVVISSDGHFALSGAWDGTLRLWDLNRGVSTRTFVGHSKDVLSVAFSPDNRQIVSGSRDRSIKLWNTLAKCMYTINDRGHSDWVSCVRFSPNVKNSIMVSGGWDKTVKVWSLPSCTLKTDLKDHKAYVNAVTVSPDGSLCASGGKDGTAILWDLNEGSNLYSLQADSVIYSLAFSPACYWLCAATDKGIKIWDLESKAVVADLGKSDPKFQTQGKCPDPSCISIAWSSDGKTLYAGYTDNLIRVYEPHGRGLQAVSDRQCDRERRREL